MPIQHTQLAVRSGRVPTEREVLKLAEQVSFVFGLSEAAGLKEQLRRDAEVYRDWLHYQQHLKDEAQHHLPGPETLTFLLALLFTCPQILSKPAGFEWVLQDLETLLFARRLDPATDQVFEKAIAKARTRSRVGPPKNKALEYFRYATINQLMNPSVVIPGVTARMGKTKAVEFVAEIEHRNIGGDAGVSSIWKSYKRADQFFRQFLTRMQDKSLLNSPLTDRSDSESEGRVQTTKKPVTRSKPRHRRRRT